MSSSLYTLIIGIAHRNWMLHSFVRSTLPPRFGPLIPSGATIEAPLPLDCVREIDARSRNGPGSAGRRPQPTLPRWCGRT